MMSTVVLPDTIRPSDVSRDWTAHGVAQARGGQSRDQDASTSDEHDSAVARRVGLTCSRGGRLRGGCEQSEPDGCEQSGQPASRAVLSHGLSPQFRVTWVPFTSTSVPLSSSSFAARIATPDEVVLALADGEAAPLLHRRSTARDLLDSSSCPTRLEFDTARWIDPPATRVLVAALSRAARSHLGEMPRTPE